MESSCDQKPKTQSAILVLSFLFILTVYLRICVVLGSDSPVKQLRDAIYNRIEHNPINCTMRNLRRPPVSLPHAGVIVRTWPFRHPPGLIH